MRRFAKQLNILMAAVLVLLLITPILPAAAAAAPSGECGSGVEWSLSGGVLTISGSGHMTNYDEYYPAPWSIYADVIHTVVVEKGVRSVGEFAFFRMENLTSVTLGSSVQEVGGWAFYGCSALTVVDLGQVSTIRESAFERCYALQSIRLPSDLVAIERHAFFRCESLRSITVPASVSYMGEGVFSYCTDLTSAVVLASMTELPLWSFYGCYALSSVTLSPKITELGEKAFEDCENLEGPVYSATAPSVTITGSSSSGEVTVDTVYTDTVPSVTVTESSTSNGVTVDTVYTEKPSSTINSQTTTTQNPVGTDVTVEIDAVLEDSAGWKDVEDQVDEVLKGSDSTQVNVNLKGEPEISGEDLGRFAGKDVELTIRTSQGAVWHVNGGQLATADLADKYDLSFTLTALTDPTDGQIAAVGTGKSFTVVFHEDINFKVEVELPLGTALARDTAVFFAPGEKRDTYNRMQAVVIDTQGIAHFYLGQVNAEEIYLIGINVPNPEAADTTVSDAIIPNTMKNEYPNIEQVSEIEYVITGTKSSWGMNIGQVSWILFGGMGACVVIVGVVVGVLYKQKVKRGYVPDMSYADDEE